MFGLGGGRPLVLGGSGNRSVFFLVSSIIFLKLCKSVILENHPVKTNMTLLVINPSSFYQDLDRVILSSCFSWERNPNFSIIFLLPDEVVSWFYCFSAM